MKIKCPVCGGPSNQQWFSHLEKEQDHTYAVFIVECWSGDLNTNSKYHYFLAKIRLIKENEIDQIKELEEKIRSIESQLSKIVEERR